MDGHALSVFTNRSVTAPLSPQIKKSLDKSNVCIRSPEVPPALPCSEVELLLQGNIELHKAVQLCREEYQSTLGTMQALRAARTSLCSSVCDEEDITCKSSKRDFQDIESIARGNFATSDPFCDTGTSCDTNDPFSSPGMELVERMWENFSVDSYAAELQLDWVRPTITIPEPFAMTLREPRRKSRSMLIAEKERMEKAAQMEAEMKKQFRSTPVPASTFLPLYTLMRAKDTKRRQKFSTHTEANLRSPGYAGTDRRRPYSAGCTERLMFKAKPIPKAILDCDVTERMKCEEEYRKVRMKVRAQGLLASSHLPFTSHYSAPSQIDLRRQGTLHEEHTGGATSANNATITVTSKTVNTTAPLINGERRISHGTSCDHDSGKRCEVYKYCASPELKAEKVRRSVPEPNPRLHIQHPVGKGMAARHN